MKNLSMGSRNLGITLNKPMIKVTKSKKLLKMGNNGGFRPLYNHINLTLLYGYT